MSRRVPIRSVSLEGADPVILQEAVRTDLIALSTELFRLSRVRFLESVGGSSQARFSSIFSGGTFPLAANRVVLTDATGALTTDAQHTYGTRTLTLGDGLLAPELKIDGAAGSTRTIGFYTGGSQRWLVRLDGTAESGGDAGSVFQIVARTDAGVFIDAPIQILRPAGAGISFARPVLITSTTDSTTTSTGSLTTLGGVGIAKALWVGGLANVAGVLTAANATDATTPTAAGTVISGGLGIAKTVRLASTTDATTTATGSLITAGGMGIAKALWIGGLTNIAGVLTAANTTDSSSLTTGSIVTAGGAGIAKSMNVGLSLVLGASYTTAGTAVFGATSTVVGDHGILARNLSAAATAYSYCLVRNDVPTNLALVAYSSGYTATVFGIVAANYMVVQAYGASLAGLMVGCLSVDKPIIFGINASEVARFTGGTLSTQSLSVKYTTDATSTSTGSITTVGGVSMAKALWVGGLANIAGSLTLSVAGGGILVKEGTNATSGAATLVAGTVTVNTTKVTANSRIYLTVQSLGTVAVATPIAVTARVAATSFTITSSSITDTSVIAWIIVEPAP
jgi:hypothetical protein